MGASAHNMPWNELSDGTLEIEVHTRVYPLTAIFRACYLFTDRCYLFLDSDESGECIRVKLAGKEGNANLQAIAGEFCNELINQRVRHDIAKETRSIRELIVAQAFAEADFRSGSMMESDYHADPKGIAK
jgi:His-Xaa-Ser system protein HxsD